MKRFVEEDLHTPKRPSFIVSKRRTIKRDQRILQNTDHTFNVALVLEKSETWSLLPDEIKQYILLFVPSFVKCALHDRYEDLCHPCETMFLAQDGYYYCDYGCYEMLNN